MLKHLTLVSLLFLFQSFKPQNEIDKNLLCQKWHLEKYEVFWVDFDPEPNEKGDYLDLKKDFTYTSVDEGACDEGTWQLMKDDKGFILINNKGESLAFTIEELTENHLVVTAQVEDLIDVNIHFTSKNQ